MRAMHPALERHTLTWTALRGLIDAVKASVVGNGDVDGDPYALRPALARPKIAMAFKAGLRMIAAYLRRFVLLLALELEHGLVDRLDPEAEPVRPKGRPEGKTAKPRRATFVVLDERLKREFDEGLRAWGGPLADKPLWQQPVVPRGRPVEMKGFYRQLDLLAAIAANPLPRALRLAWWLARCRPGPIVAPDLDYRPPDPCRRLWTLEPSLSFTLMATDIIARSRKRPPPLAPPRRAGPSIHVF
jgi:hypothetical protein